MGIAPPGGKIPDQWRTVILQAIQLGWNVLSGLHDFLGEDPEFGAAADANQVTFASVGDKRKDVIWVEASHELEAALNGNPKHAKLYHDALATAYEKIGNEELSTRYRNRATLLAEPSP